MNYYEETYNKFVKDLALDELETLKETMIYEYNDLDSEYDALFNEYNRKMKSVKNKNDRQRQKETNRLFKSIYMSLFFCFIFSIDVNPLAILITMEVGFVSSLLLSYKKYCKVMDVFEKKEKILKKEYEDSSDKLYSKLNLISKYIDKLSMEIFSKKQDLALSVNECGKLYMDLSEDKVDYVENTKGKVKPYVKKRKLNDK